jgi:flagellar biogenesis protein FliO
MTQTFWIRYAIAVATVCVALWVLSRLATTLRRRKRAGDSAGLSVIASIALAPNLSAHIVRAGELEFLIAAGGTPLLLVQQARNDVDHQRQDGGAITERD